MPKYRVRLRRRVTLYQGGEIEIDAPTPEQAVVCAELAEGRGDVTWAERLGAPGVIEYTAERLPET